MLNEFLKEFLPTPLTRWIATGTISLAGICALLPEWLQKIDPATKVIEPLGIRLYLILSILLIGTFLILVTVLFHVRKLNKIIAKGTRKPGFDIKKFDISKHLAPERGKVIAAFIDNERLYESQLENVLSMSKERAVFHLNDLAAMGMVYEYYDQERFWILEQEGRRYLVFHDLLP